MKRVTKRINKLITSLLTVFSLTAFSSCASPKQDADIVIVFTSDVHCAIDDNLGYASLASYVNETKKNNKYCTLVDAGDAIQGNLVGSLSKGEYIIDIMNSLDYDLYVLGNHEFDYGLDNLALRINEFEGDVLSCNISYTGTKENKLRNVKPYSIISYGSTKVGYVGVTTPSALNTSNPANFKENEQTVYSFAADNLAETVQKNVDKCHQLGCKYVVLLAHLGYADNYQPFSSREIINQTSGVVAVIDGHSHQKVPCNYYENKEGIRIPLCTPGYQMNAFGKLTLGKDQTVKMDLITEYSNKDQATQTLVDNTKTKLDEDLNKVVAHSDLALSIYDQNGIRIARSRETGLGDLVSDSFRNVSGSDIALVNGGGLRDDIKEGDLTFGDIKKVLPFDNQLVMINAKGQQILDYLEFASRKTQNIYTDGQVAIGENGGFAQVSGLKYTIDTSIPSSVVTTDAGDYVRVDGIRRVKNVQVLENGQYVAIDAQKTYSITSFNFMLIDGGDGVNMFKTCEILNKNVRLDVEALIYYLVDVLHGNLKDLYSDATKRITII